jgi:xylulokinase
MSRLVLTVDLGTGGPKVGLVTTDGTILHWEHFAVRTVREAGGASTQDASEWWDLVVKGTRSAMATTGAQPADVVAVCATGQWASTVPVDAGGLPVGDCVMWNDSRGKRHSRQVVGGHLQGYRARALATWIRHSGGVPSTSGDDPVGHMLHLDRDRPEVAARWYLEPVDYLAMRFTGVPAATPMSMTAAWLTDNRQPGVPTYDERLVELAGVDATRLPPLVPTGSVIGPVLPAVAAELGIAATAQVVTGLPDLHGAAVGSGCVREHQAHVSIGTTGWASCPVSAKKTDVIRQIATVPGLGEATGPAGYLIGNNQESAGRCLEWFRDTIATTPGGRRPSYPEITALAAESPAGAGGVIFTPWLAGERSPVDDRTARGGFHNVSLGTSQADLARAVLEGVALNLRWLLGAVDHMAGRRLDPLRIVGGGAQSELWCQIVADVCDRQVERVAEPLLAGLRGAALYAGIALGDVDPTALTRLVPLDGHFLPDPANRATYDRAFAEFPRLHHTQRRMFRRLNAPAR